MTRSEVWWCDTPLRHMRRGAHREGSPVEGFDLTPGDVLHGDELAIAAAPLPVHDVGAGHARPEDHLVVREGRRRDVHLARHDARRAGTAGAGSSARGLRVVDHDVATEV